HAVGFTAGDALQGFGVQDQGDVGVGVDALLDGAGTVLHHQGVVLAIFDVELEDQVQAGGGARVELGLHAVDDVGNGAHVLFPCFRFFWRLGPICRTHR